MKKIFFHRDFIILVVLLVMLKMGMDIRETRVKPTHVLVAPPSMHLPTPKPIISPQETHIVSNEPEIKSITDDDEWEVTGEIEKKELAPFVAHEVDQNVLKQIDCTRNQIEKALELTQPASLDAAQLHSLQQKLSQLRVQYTRTSPAVAMLGPLGTAAIVLKEQELENALLAIVHKLATLLHKLAGDTYEQTDSIVAELESNHNRLKQLISA